MPSTSTTRVDPPSTSGFNLLPFAAMAGGWLAPMAMFWLQVWGPLRSFDQPTGELMPGPWFLVVVAACIGLWWALPRGYYRIRSYERARRLHERLGVRYFRMLVPDGDLANRWARRSDPGHRMIRNRRSAEAFVDRTIDSERGHVVLLGLGLATAAHATSIGWTGWALYLTLGNLVVNVYPILLQRYTRARLGAVLDRRAGRPRTPGTRPAPGSSIDDRRTRGRASG